MLYIHSCHINYDVILGSAIAVVVIVMLNKNTWGVKRAGPIRSNIANRQARPKGLISAEAKKL